MNEHLNPATHRPRFLLYWPSWVTLVVVSLTGVLTCYHATSELDGDVPMMTGVGLSTWDVEDGWPFRHSQVTTDATPRYSEPPKPDLARKWFPLGLAGDIVAMVWIVVGNVYVIESFCRSLRTPPRLRILTWFAALFWVGLALGEVNRLFDNWPDEYAELGFDLNSWLYFRIADAVYVLAPFLLTILPAYATVKWIGQLWDCSLRRKRMDAE